MKLLIVIIWIGLAWVNAGFLSADFNHIGDDLPGFQYEHYREVLAASLGVSLLFGPAAWAITPFVTGFYEHGWLKPTLTNPFPKDGVKVL